jgi:hypothetical protein
VLCTMLSSCQLRLTNPVAPPTMKVSAARTWPGDYTDRRIALTPKGIEFRDRLLAMLTPG